MENLDRVTTSSMLKKSSVPIVNIVHLGLAASSYLATVILEAQLRSLVKRLADKRLKQGSRLSVLLVDYSNSSTTDTILDERMCS